MAHSEGRCHVTAHICIARANEKSGCCLLYTSTTQLAALQTAGHHVILVSSGAIAAGFSRLGFKKRPTKIADKQAAAAVGQGLLMEEYTKNLMAYQIPCAQILLNRSDFEDRRRYKNIFGSLSVLLGRGAIPIINENDTIAIEELKVGDNDTLSAQAVSYTHLETKSFSAF